MPFPRAAGVLLHPTSFPGPYGIGDLGESAYRFVDFLVASGLRLWQVNPLGPTGHGDSPYSSLSAFAGNSLLISPDRLCAVGLLTEEDLGDRPDFPADRVDFNAVIPWKRALLERAYRRYQDGGGGDYRHRIEAFATAPELQLWLPDYALFMALKEHHGGANWNDWEDGARFRAPEALAHWRAELDDLYQYHVFVQSLFREQWAELKGYARQLGISVIGDIPIFVAYDSADVWAHRDLFELDGEGHSIAVAGVPPDYFSDTGQLWGNPLYRWDVMVARQFDWWIDRFRTTLTMVDAVRLDHFRGFESYWRVPAGSDNAIPGEWVVAPGEALFRAVEGSLGVLPIMAEDLGVITPAVEALRDAFDFPGMKVLQFAFFPGSKARFLPHEYATNSVVYTGTHDNDTVVGWWQTCSEEERERVRRYLGHEPWEINWWLIRLAMSSVADTVLIPMQDVLGLGPEGRMNLPGQAEGNWSWRVPPGLDQQPLIDRLRDLAEIYDRV